jgi:predicted phage terminase large subunit-like protein
VTAARKLPTPREAKLELARRRVANDIGAFIETTSPRFRRPRHLGKLLAALDHSLTAPVFATVSVPPRHAKTQTMLHHMVRYLKKYPDRIVCYATYNQTRARKMSREARKLARAAGLKIGGTLNGSTDLAANSVDFWQTPQGGGFLAAGRGSSLTGEGVHLLVIDDPVKGRDETNSVTIRENVWEWFTGTAYIRLEPGGSCFVVHTRWHQDDLIGRISSLKARGAEAAADDDLGELAGEEWEHINIAAVAANDNGGLEPLWPERYDLKKLQRIRATIGEHDWWSLFMGAPRPREAVIFGDCTFYTPPANTNGRKIAIAVDCAGTESTRADWTVAVVFSYWRDRLDPNDKDSPTVLFMDVLEVRRWQIELLDIPAELAELQKKNYPGAPIIVETQGAEGRAVAETLRRLDRDLKIIGVPAQVDKLTRATPAAKAWSMGRIRLPQKAKWLPPFLRVVQNFTGNDRHDDDVDALAHAWNYADRGAPVRESGRDENRKRRKAAGGMGGY